MASGRLLDIREMTSSRLHSFCHSVLTSLLDAISNPAGVGMKGKNSEKEAKIVPPWLVLFNMQASCILCLAGILRCRVLRGFLEDDLLVSWGLWFPWCEWCSDAFQLPLAFASRSHFRFSSSDDRRLSSWAGVILNDLQANVPFAGVNSSPWNSCTLTICFQLEVWWLSSCSSPLCCRGCFVFCGHDHIAVSHQCGNTCQACWVLLFKTSLTRFRMISQSAHFHPLPFRKE